MAVFDLEVDAGRLDFQLARTSAVTLFWRSALVDEAVGWLRRHGYTVVAFDAGAWVSDDDLHRDVAAALGFPDYYGKNLDALNDCLRDVVNYEYGTTRQATGLVLTFVGYDAFASRHPRTAQIVLDIVAEQARCAMLTGHRMLCLVQSGDPAITFEPVGAMPVVWNHAEWLDSQRRPGSVPHRLISD
ncbi:barstar family protein [Actinoplanes couchii]|uniref:Barstar (barnase inhibitor) domain-containing protein n=1 Tax=Actinoplanes couchii TaxID=403638 RepID=A0ABQ3XPV3_9ACTN|nr:barstar family protein [Actinoplanes couchii]MDR6319160.1 hypothetical protein [Actinoplanes couchii]GID60500.1 hypothetical protein Aco03nite_089040 [Actinoplanes couchii]